MTVILSRTLCNWSHNSGLTHTIKGSLLESGMHTYIYRPISPLARFAPEAASNLGPNSCPCTRYPSQQGGQGQCGFQSMPNAQGLTYSQSGIEPMTSRSQILKHARHWTMSVHIHAR
jgi:hypothetical protein